MGFTISQKCARRNNKQNLTIRKNTEAVLKDLFEAYYHQRLGVESQDILHSIRKKRIKLQRVKAHLLTIDK